MPANARLNLDARSVLACIPVFGGVDMETLRHLGAASRLIELPSQRSLFNSGQPIRELHYLVSGSIKRFVLRPDCVENVLELVAPGRLFALSEAIIGGHYASFAETISFSIVLAIEAETLRKLAGTDAQLASNLLGALARQQYAAEFGAVRHHSLSVTQRVLDYLVSLAGNPRRLAGETTVHLGASKRLIAARLDMAPETLSRTLRQLSDDGVIVVAGRTVHIQNATLAVGGRRARGLPLPPVHYPRQERGSEPEQLSAAELVNVCGRHRMLSQRLAIAWIQRNRGVAVRAAGVALRKYHAEFIRNLVRIRALDLPQQMQSPIEALQAAWQDFTRGLAEPKADAATLGEMFARSEDVLAAADRLTAAAAELAGSEQAVLVNLAGRNRMLCPRIAKLVLFADAGIHRDAASALIDEARREFQANLQRLRAGSVDSKEAQVQLGIDASQWLRFMDRVDAVITATDKGSRHAQSVIPASEEMLRHADATVKLFELLGTQRKKA
jgi:CRP-like cAMP-binding protein